MGGADVVLVALSLHTLDCVLYLPASVEGRYEGSERLCPGVSHASATRITAAAVGWAKSIFLLWLTGRYAPGITDSLAR